MDKKVLFGCSYHQETGGYFNRDRYRKHLDAIVSLYTPLEECSEAVKTQVALLDAAAPDAMALVVLDGIGERSSAFSMQETRFYYVTAS